MSAISRINWRVRVIMGLVLALVCSFSSFMFASASGAPLQISSDPYTNSTSQHKTQVEPDTFSYAKTIVSAFQTGRFNDGGSSNTGWATSTDAGKSWKHGFLPGTTVYATPKGKYARVSDMAVTYDAKHGTWMIESLALNVKGGAPFGAAILVSRSTDGLTWSNPVEAQVAHGTAFFDKSWIACDNSAKKSKFYGHCYIEFDDFGQGDLIQLSTSTDGGKTWGAIQGTKDHATGSGGLPQIQPNGTVIVPIDNAFASSVQAFNSTDGGKSWSSITQVASISRSAPGGGAIRAPDLISAQIDGAGKVYVAWYDCSFESGCSANDIVYTTSTNGTSWSKIQRVPIDKVGSGVDHFIPGIALDKKTSGSSAHLGVVYYFFPKANCTLSTCQLEAGFVSSTNGGSTWSSATVLTPSPMKLTWLAATTQGNMVGDYISASFVNTGKAVPVFIDATAPSGKVLNEAAYSWPGGLDIVGGSLSSANDRVISRSVSPLVTQSAN